jgi:hypothetical protein
MTAAAAGLASRPIRSAKVGRWSRAAALKQSAEARLEPQPPKEIGMVRRSTFVVACVAALAAGVALAQQFPILDNVANKVVQKYQSMSCEQLWAQKSQPKSAEEQRVIGLLKQDPAMRTEFVNRVAAPIVNKMFECGMVP